LIFIHHIHIEYSYHNYLLYNNQLHKQIFFIIFALILDYLHIKLDYILNFKPKHMVFDLRHMKMLLLHIVLKSIRSLIVHKLIKKPIFMLLLLRKLLLDLQSYFLQHIMHHELIFLLNLKLIYFLL